MARTSRQVHTDKQGRKTFTDTGEKYKKEDLYKKVKKKKITRPPIIKLNEPKEKKQGIASTALDIVSAPLSQPRTTLTKGLRAGTEEVKQRREDIKAGKKGGLGVIGTTLASTAVVAGGVVAAGSLFATTIAADISLSAESITTIRTGIQNRAIVGKLIEMGGNAPIIATRFATTTKSLALTNSILIKLGTLLKNPVFVAGSIVGIIGSYPFAGFIKEEALQTLSFATNGALTAGDLEGAQTAINETNEILNPSLWKKIFAIVPYANIVSELKTFYKVATIKNAQAQEALNIRRQEMEGDRETPFEEERRLSDEKANERKETERKSEEERTLNEMKWKANYYQLIRDGKFQEADELLREQE